MKLSKKYLFYLITAALIAGAQLSLMNSAVFAQDASRSQFDLEVSPPVSYLSVKPGEKSSFQLAITHRGTVPLEITPSVVDFETDGVGNAPILGTQSSFRELNLEAPIKFGESLMLQPGETKRFRFEIDATLTGNESLPKEYHQVILFSAKPGKGVVGSDSSSVGGVVSGVVITSVTQDGEDTSALIFKDLDQTIPRFTDSLLGVSFKVFAENSGGNAGAASGSARLHSPSGEIIKEWQFYPDMVLAQNSRQLRTFTTTPDDLSGIITQFRHKPAFMLGRYQLELELYSADKTTTDTATYYFLALPFTIIGAAISGIILYFILTKLLSKLESRTQNNLYNESN